MTKPKEMNGEDFGLALLAALEENEGTKPLRVAIRKALGIPEPAHSVPVPYRPQSSVRPEYPQFRVKSNAHGEEIARSPRLDSMNAFQELLKSEPEMLWQISIAVPIEKDEVA
jgi:hypothetical protein